ncbi:MAG: HAD family phosphatase [Pseudomonadota bacterium]
MRPEALIFDMDGLMIDSERLYFEAEREIAGRFGKTVEDRTLWNMMGRKPLESLAIYAKDLGLAGTVTPEELLGIRDKIMKKKLAADLEPMPGLERIIGDFHGTLKLAVATGAPMEFLDITLDGLDLRDKFDVLQASDDIGRGKPDPEIYLTTCARLRLAPEACVVLEDAQHGVVAAKAAGCHAVAVPTEYSTGQDFSRADFIAPDLSRAADYIHELMNR